MPAFRRIAGYGWVPDLPDHRDFMLEHDAVGILPASIDLSPYMPPVYNQLDLGSCTANAIAAAYDYDIMKSGRPTFGPSRLFIYYNERAREGTVMSDAGASLRDGIKSLAAEGVCREAHWPYDVTRFTERPPSTAYAEARQSRALLYRRVPRSQTSMRATLADGYPFTLGFSVYESFESDETARTGIVPMPAHGEVLLGGHAVLVVGYDDETNRFKVRNSWSVNWGMDGYCTMPYEYVLSPRLASDFWVVSKVV